MADLFVRLEQHMMLVEARRLQMRFEILQVGREKQAEQKVLHRMHSPVTGGSAKNSQLSVPRLDNR